MSNRPPNASVAGGVRLLTPRPDRLPRAAMTFLIVYLIGYFALLGGAGFVLWQSGMMRELPDVWVAVAFIAAAALGILLGVLSYPRTARSTGTEPSDF